MKIFEKEIELNHIDELKKTIGHYRNYLAKILTKIGRTNVIKM